MRRLAVVLAAALLTCGACGAGNADPRNGKVVIDRSNCLFGGCYELSKICIGPDLHTVYDESGYDDYSRVDENSPECEVAQ